jgi:hypothetical protein
MNDADQPKASSPPFAALKGRLRGAQRSLLRKLLDPRRQNGFPVLRYAKEFAERKGVNFKSGSLKASVNYFDQ